VEDKKEGLDLDALDNISGGANASFIMRKEDHPPKLDFIERERNLGPKPNPELIEMLRRDDLVFGRDEVSRSPNKDSVTPGV